MSIPIEAVIDIRPPLFYSLPRNPPPHCHLIRKIWKRLFSLFFLLFLVLLPLSLFTGIGMDSRSGLGSSPHSSIRLNNNRLFGAAEPPKFDADYIEKDPRGRYVRVLYCIFLYCLWFYYFDLSLVKCVGWFDSSIFFFLRRMLLYII